MNRLSYSKIYYIIAGILLVIFFCLGAIYFYITKDIDLDYGTLVNNFTNTLSSFKQTSFLIDIVIISFLFLTSFLLIGSILFTIFLLFKTFSFGFFCATLINTLKIKGVFLALEYLLIYKILLLVLYIVFGLYLYKISLMIIKKLRKDTGNLNLYLIKYFKKEIINYFLICIISIVTYFVGGKILNFIAFFI